MKKHKKRKSGHKARGHRGGKKYSGKNYVLKGDEKLYGAAAAAYLKKHPRAPKRSKAKHSR